MSRKEGVSGGKLKRTTRGGKAENEERKTKEKKLARARIVSSSSSLFFFSLPCIPDRSRVERDLQAAVALALFVGVDAASVRRPVHSATGAAPAAAAKARMPPSSRSGSSSSTDASSEAAAGACAWLVPRDDLLEVAARHLGRERERESAKAFWISNAF